MFLLLPSLLLSLSPVAVAQSPEAVAQPPVVEPAPVAPPARSEMRAVWTGGTGGIGAGTYDFEMYTQMADEGTLASVQAVHGWFARGPWLLSADSARVVDGLELLKEPTCTRVGSTAEIRTPAEQVIARGPLPEWTAKWGGVRTARSLWRCTRGELQGTLWGPPTADEPPSTWQVSGWEFRMGLDLRAVDGSVVHSVGIPAGEGTRRFAVLQAATAADGVVYMDAGDFVDGASSVRDDGLSLHRAAAFAMLRRLKPAALAPGRNELAGGARTFIGEAGDLPYVASNWSSEDPDLALPAHRSVRVDLGDRSVTVGFVGALDPGMARALPILAAEGVRLTDPVQSVQAAVHALHAADPPAQVVVLLTTARGAVLSELRSEVRGLDLIVGDTEAQASQLASFDMVLQPARLARASHSTTVPAEGVIAAQLALTAKGQLSAVRALPIPVRFTTEPDPTTLAAVSGVRATEYPPLDRALVPAADPLATLEHTEWSKLVCEAVAEHTQADVVLLPALPQGRPVPGALTELLAVDRLAMPDRVEVHRVPGARLRRLLDQLYGTVPVSCGSPLGVKLPKARGRLIEDERTYKVATTDRMRQATGLGTLLQGARSPRRLDQPGHAVPHDADGTPMTLRSTALAALRTLREVHGDGLVSELTGRSAANKPPQWLLRVRQASLTVEGFQGANDDAYAEVPETLVTSPSSFTLGSGLDVALDYSSSTFNWDMRARSVFTRLRTDEASQETADDLKLSTSTNLPGAATPAVAGLSFSPYAEAMLDSEWTAVDEAPQRQADASLTVGMAAKRVGVLRALRVGVLTNKDVAVPDKKPEVGARIEAQTRAVFGPGMVWTNQLDGFVYGNTDDQDTSDLRFKTQLDSRIALPLSRWLSVAVYGRGFAFQGRTEATQAVRWSGSLGAALDVSGALHLGR